MFHNILAVPAFLFFDSKSQANFAFTCCSTHNKIQYGSKLATFTNFFLQCICKDGIESWTHSLPILYHFMSLMSLIAKRTVQQVVGIVDIWDICPKISLYNSLAALIRHSQAQKCLQINPKPFQQVVMNFKNFLFS